YSAKYKTSNNVITEQNQIKIKVREHFSRWTKENPQKFHTRRNGKRIMFQRLQLVITGIVKYKSDNCRRTPTRYCYYDTYNNFSRMPSLINNTKYLEVKYHIPNIQKAHIQWQPHQHAVHHADKACL
ncbi:40799_t:CDS:2, partial [Gigaspora margarita]